MSKCIYCGSQAYGRGCPFSPHKIHVHLGNVRKCIYCGSVAMGMGCPFNPHSKMHVHGVEYNQMVRDSAEHTLTSVYLIDKLNTPIEEHPAFQLGLIDAKGRKLREPETLEEKNAFTLTDQYIIRIKDMLGCKLDMVNTSLYLEHNEVEEINAKQFAENYENELIIKRKLTNLVEEFKILISDSKQQGLTTNSFEKILMEILNNEENS